VVESASTTELTCHAGVKLRRLARPATMRRRRSGASIGGLCGSLRQSNKVLLQAKCFLTLRTLTFDALLVSSEALIR